MTLEKDTNFTVFTTNRSGSVWVMSTLNSIPHITAQGELFLPKKRVSEKRWDTSFAIPRYIEAQSDKFKLRPFSVFSYLRNLYSTPGVVGFKLMYRQLGLYPEILIYLIRCGIRVVHLIRKNHFDVLLSYAIKAEIGQAHILEGQSAPEKIKVSLDAENILNRMEFLDRKQKFASRLLRWSRLPHIEIAYEDLLEDQNNFRLILDFLSISPLDQLPQSSLVKIRRGGHRDVIRNYDMVKQVMADSKFARLLD